MGVISTVTLDGKPEAAVMVISQTDNFELIFQTPNDSRKYQNLKKNPNVAVAFGFDLEEFITVQFEGIAREVKGDEIDECRKIHVAKNPKSADYAYLPENKYFKVNPRWMTYLDFKKDKKFELTF
ncbi:pyridoxamine 5'-phosphate oxidase family protein [Patescibacteria group bacterium]|nr:pyridoxamine 5'-phosphate oxidase family protein [Patescibacteria group bacterium]